MDKPTQEQTKKFWERYGLEESLGYFYYNRRQVFDGSNSIDLNNLFRYAVPKAIVKYDLKMFSFYDDLNDKVFWFVHAIDRVTGEVELANIEGREELKDALFEVLQDMEETLP